MAEIFQNLPIFLPSKKSFTRLIYVNKKIRKGEFNGMISMIYGGENYEV